MGSQPENGGSSGIRTHETRLRGLFAFQANAIDRSAILPLRRLKQTATGFEPADPFQDRRVFPSRFKPLSHAGCIKRLSIDVFCSANGIRTHGGLSPSSDFESDTFSHLSHGAAKHIKQFTYVIPFKHKKAPKSLSGSGLSFSGDFGRLNLVRPIPRAPTAHYPTSNRRNTNKSDKRSERSFHYSFLSLWPLLAGLIPLKGLWV